MDSLHLLQRERSPHFWSLTRMPADTAVVQNLWADQRKNQPNVRNSLELTSLTAFRENGSLRVLQGYVCPAGADAVRFSLRIRAAATATDSGSDFTCCVCAPSEHVLLI